MLKEDNLQEEAQEALNTPVEANDDDVDNSGQETQSYTQDQEEQKADAQESQDTKEDEEDEDAIYKTAKEKQRQAFLNQRERANKLSAQLAKISKELKSKDLGYIDEEGNVVIKNQSTFQEESSIRDLDNEISKIEQALDDGEISEIRAKAEIEVLTAEKRELKKQLKAKQEEFGKKQSNEFSDEKDIRQLYASKILSEYKDADRPGTPLYQKMVEIYQRDRSRFPDVGQAGENFEYRYLLAVEANQELALANRRQRQGAQKVNTQNTPKPQATAGLENQAGYKPTQKEVSIADKKLAEALSPDSLDKLKRFTQAIDSKKNFKGAENAFEIEF
jgi:hypothetical protein